MPWEQWELPGDLQDGRHWWDGHEDLGGSEYAGLDWAGLGWAG